MTTATVATGNRTMATVVRPRRSLEELVDQLFAAMGFKDETETAEPSPDAEYPRGSTTQAGGAGSRRGAGGLRRHGHGEGDD